MTVISVLGVTAVLGIVTLLLNSQRLNSDLL